MSAQAIVALMGSIPGEAVMGLIGPQFVSGTAALGFLLWGEVLATQGAVSEAALVYMARHRNLADFGRDAAVPDRAELRVDPRDPRGSAIRSIIRRRGRRSR